MPIRVKQAGVFAMAAWATINPLSGTYFRPPFYGLITYLITVWWLYNKNPMHLIRQKDDPITQEQKQIWLLKSFLWGLLFNIILKAFYLIL